MRKFIFVSIFIAVLLIGIVSVYGYNDINDKVSSKVYTKIASEGKARVYIQLKDNVNGISSAKRGVRTAQH